MISVYNPQVLIVVQWEKIVVLLELKNSIFYTTGKFEVHLKKYYPVYIYGVFNDQCVFTSLS